MAAEPPLSYTGYAVSTIAFLEDTWKVRSGEAARVVQEAKTCRFGIIEAAGHKFTVTLTGGGLFTVRVEPVR